MKLLITGGAGYIGSHTCVELLDAGHEVVIYDNLSNSSKLAVDRIEKITGKKAPLIIGDIADEEALDALFAANKIDGVIHFAGLKAVGESVEKPLEYYENNVSGTLALLRSMRRAGCKNIVFSSSATVYGMVNQPPFVETMPLSTTNPYGSTKLMVEMILKDLCESDPTWSCVNLRYFNPIGAHPAGLLGEDPKGIPNNLLPYVMQVAVGRRPCVNIMGDDYPTPDGTGVRDYIHVVDLALGHLAALKAWETTGNHVFNLGTGNGSSVKEVVAAFSKACGQDLPAQIVPRRAGDVAFSFANAEKAKEVLGWEATRNMEEMCKDAWNFIKNNPQGIVE